MKKKRPIELMLISTFAIILGAWMFLKYVGFAYYILSNFLQLANSIDIVAILNVFLSLLYACVLIGGISFLLLKKWGRTLLLVSFLIDALFRLYGIVNIWRLSFIITKPVVIPEGAHVVRYNMSLEYVIFLVEIVILFYLAHPKIKESFK